MSHRRENAAPRRWAVCVSDASPIVLCTELVLLWSLPVAVPRRALYNAVRTALCVCLCRYSTFYIAALYKVYCTVYRERTVEYM